MNIQDHALNSEFEGFVAGIERRLAERAAARREVLSTEIARLRVLLDRAEALEAADVAEEIRAALRPRLASLALVGGEPTPVSKPVEPAPVVEKPVAKPVPPKPAPPKPVVVAKPVAVPVATPKPVELPKPPPPKKPTLSRVQYGAAIRKQNEARHEFLAVATMSPVREARLKSLVCEERRLHEAAGALGMDDGFDFRRSLEELRERFLAQASEKEFFGFNVNRFHSVETWERLAEGFALLATSEEALTMLEKADPPLAGDERFAVLSAAAAPEAHLFRVLKELVPPAASAQLQDIHDRIEIAREGVYLPVYNLAATTNERVEKEAREAPTVLAQIRDRLVRTERKRTARETLHAIAAKVEAPGAFEETVVPAVRAFLEAGHPPSDKALVELVLPFRQALEDLDDPAFTVLLRNLRQRETLLLRKGIPNEVQDDLENSESTNEIVAKVREFLRGKTLLMVGGNPIPERVEDIAKAFECEVLWPQTKNETNVNDLIKRVREADVVVRMIRWSRHSYVLVNDEARRLGKASINLKAGYGVNRLAHDLHEQLLAKSA